MFEKLSENLTLLMNRVRITAHDLATATGIPMSTLKKIRTQVNTNPTISTLIPIAQHFSVSLDQIVMGNVLEPNREGARLLPIVNWKEAVEWQAIYRENATFLVSEYDFSLEAFALRVESDEFRMFPLHSVLLVETNRQPVHREYVVVHQAGQEQVTLKQYIVEDGSAWLRSINILENTIALTAAYRVLGVIVEYRMQLSSIENNISKYKLKFRETIL